MTRIFIDANAYLQFFIEKKAQRRKLLDTLLELKDEIIVTQQVVDEVSRNKLGVASVSVRELRSKLLPSKDNEEPAVISKKGISLPDLFADVKDEAATAWNDKRAEVAKSTDELLNDLDEYANTLLMRIQRSEDHVSCALNSIFAGALAPTPEQLDRARLRKEIGNPPGKRQDPLGDQISWEQILDTHVAGERLWLVTSDKDYAIERQGKHFLNPFLFAELKAKEGGGEGGGEVDVRIYTKIAEALPEYETVEGHPLQKLPKPEELKEIVIEEEVRVTDYVSVSTYQASRPSGSVAMPAGVFSVAANVAFPDAYDLVPTTSGTLLSGSVSDGCRQLFKVEPPEDSDPDHEK